MSAVWDFIQNLIKNSGNLVKIVEGIRGVFTDAKEAFESRGMQATLNETFKTKDTSGVENALSAPETPSPPEPVV